MLQQIGQFRNLGEDFAMQHADTEYLGELEEELQTAVLETIPVEKRLRGLSPDEILRRFTPEEVLRRFTPEEVLRGFTPEGFARGLSEEQAAQLGNSWTDGKGIELPAPGVRTMPGNAGSR